eukprot:106105_1
MADLFLLTSNIKKPNPKVLGSYHSNLCESIKLVRLLLSVLNKILTNNDVESFYQLLYYVLIPHFAASTGEFRARASTNKFVFYLLHHRQQIHQIIVQNIPEIKSIVHCMRVLFFASLFVSEFDTKYLSELTDKLLHMNDKFPADQNNNHSSLINIPLYVLSRIMSFFSLFGVIKIERTCTTFFLAADQMISFYNMHHDFFYQINKYDAIVPDFFKRFIGVSSLELPAKALSTISNLMKFIQMFKNLISVRVVINNISHLKMFLVSIATNPLHHIQNLTLDDCCIDLSIFECININS